jgi:hypothetical protein
MSKLLGSLIALFWLCSLSIAQAAESDMRFFPLKVGDARSYISFLANRANPRKKAILSKSTWQEVLEEHTIHGMRVVVVRNSYGTLTQNESGFDVGPPERIGSEGIYFITPKGVDMRAHIRSGTDAEYKQLRRKTLNLFKKMSKQDLLKQMDNWIIPFPPTAKNQRKYDGGTGAYTVLSNGDKTLLRADMRAKTNIVGVEGTQFGKWNITRWFEPGIGILQTETPNEDPETSVQFPVLCEQLQLLNTQ